MAQRTIIKLVDDLDNKEIEDDGQTVSFSYNGVQYEIDLSEKNAKKLGDALAPFVSAARRVGGRQARSSNSSSSSTKTDKHQLGAMREWARQHGMKVSNRGRVSQEVQNAYNSAH
jgi:hypothetical protein